MSEDFLKYLHNKDNNTQIVGTGTDNETPVFVSEEPQADNEDIFPNNLPEHPTQDAEVVKDIFTGEEIPVDADLSEEASGTLADEPVELINETIVCDNTQQENPKKAEPKLTICRDNTHRKGFFMPMVFVPVDTKVAIQLHLNDLALKDESFKKCLQKEEKSFDECVKYIETRIFSEMIRQAGGMDALRDGSAHIDGGFATSCQFSEEQTYKLAEYYFRDDSIEQEKKRKAEMAEKKRKREEQRKAIEKATQKGKKHPTSTTTPQATSKPQETTKNEPQAKTNKQPQELTLFGF